MAYTINRRLGELIDSTGQLNDGKIPNDYINGDHIADNTITSSMLHTTFSVPAASLTGIDTDDVSEGATNVYYTDARARGAISVSGSLSYDSGTGVVSYTTPTTIASLSNHTTDTLTEGSTNLYYTTARFDTAFSGKSTTDLSEGANLYYTDARVGSYLTANSYATQSYVSTAISNLVDSSPATLDTLNELAAALGDDPNFATTVSTNIGTKVSKTGDTMTGNLTVPSLNATDVTYNGGTGDATTLSTTNFSSLLDAGSKAFQIIGGSLTAKNTSNNPWLDASDSGVNLYNGTNIYSGNLQVGGTTVIDSSRNLTNIGTISSGAITSSGTLYANGATGTGFAGTSGIAIGGQYPAVSFESSSGYHKWLQYATSSNAFILYNATNPGDVLRIYAPNQTQQDIAFGTQGNTSWSSASRATFNINGNSTSLLGFHCGGATRGYLYAHSSALELLSYGELLLQAGASASYQAKLNSDGLIVEDGLYANGIADRNGDILYPEGGTYKSSASGNVGAIKIRLPVNNSATMMKMRVSVYLYDGNSDGRSFTLEVGGYNYSAGNWYNYFANIIGNTANDLQFNVRFGHDGTKDCIWIGETTTNWPYVQVVVENVCPGYSGYSQAVWRTGWSISLDTSLGTVEQTITANQIGRHCRGNFTSAGNITAYASDARLKKNVTPITNALEKVKRLRGVEFDWIDECEELGFKPDTKHETGVIAQEVQAVISDAVYPAPFNPEYLTVQKDKIIPVLINAVQELIQEVDSLKAKLKELENGND